MSKNANETTMIHLANKILVGLDLTEMDDLILKYLFALTNAMDHPPELVVIHNIKYEIDEDVSDLLDQPLDEIIIEELRQKLNTYLPDYQGKHQLIVTQETSTIEALTDVIKQKSIDLVVFGKKTSFDGSGLTTVRILRQNLCSLLVVPENAPLQISKAVIPIDFSKNSSRAYNIGVKLQNVERIDVRIIHIYHIPQVYFPYIPVKPITTGMDKKAREEYRHFLNRNKLNSNALDCYFIDGKDRTVVKAIVEEAREQKANLIVVGSKGESSLLGSVAVGLANYQMRIPILFIN